MLQPKYDRQLDLISSARYRHICIIINILLLKSFSHQLRLMVFRRILSDSKSPQVFRTLLSILTDLNNAVVWTVSTHPVFFKSSSPCTNLLVTVPRVSITISIIVTFIFHSFFTSLARSRYLSFFSLSFNSTSCPLGQQSPQFCKFSLFCWLL